MKTKPVLLVVGFSMLLGFAAGIALSQALSQAPAPTASRGISAVLLQTLDLTDEIDSAFGRPLRLRKITLEPGGVIGLHSHKDRPTVSYFLEGEVTYHQEGKPVTVVGPGQGFAEGKATTHWAENRGSVPAVWIAVDIPKAP
jgi:quercetin dioxygenase-like cupin family protein